MLEHHSTTAAEIPECVATAARRWRLSDLRAAGATQWRAVRYDNSRRRQDVTLTLHNDVPALDDIAPQLAVRGKVALTVTSAT